MVNIFTKVRHHKVQKHWHFWTITDFALIWTVIWRTGNHLEDFLGQNLGTKATLWVENLREVFCLRKGAGEKELFLDALRHRSQTLLAPAFFLFLHLWA